MMDDRSKLSRRQALRQILGTGFCLPFAELLTPWRIQASAQVSATPAGTVTLSPLDDQFLDEVENASFLYFWDQASPKTGMVKDRCNVHVDDQGIVASIAATGFGLTAICIGERRSFVPRDAAVERVIAALRFLWKKLPQHRGFFYHFANIKTGERVWDSEVSSVDTAILLCGVLTCRAAFSPRRYHRAGQPHLQSRGLDLALGRHLVAAPRMDSRESASLPRAGITTAN